MTHPHPATLYQNKTLVQRRQLFKQEMFKRGNITWKLRWVKIVALMIHPCRWLTVAISLSLSRSFPQSTRSLYIATGCLRFSSGPVHHPLSLALSDAWLAKRCICGGFMNKSVAINFDFNQKPMQTLNMVSLQCAVITSISKVPSFQRAVINFFALEALDHISRPWLTKEKSQQTNCVK